MVTRDESVTSAREKAKTTRGQQGNDETKQYTKLEGPKMSESVQQIAKTTTKKREHEYEDDANDWRNQVRTGEVNVHAWRQPALQLKVTRRPVKFP